MLRQRILVIIQASPGISIGELRSRVPEAKFWQVHNQLAELRKAGAIEAAGYAHYRVPLPPCGNFPHGRPEPPRGFIRPPTLARLMAGR